MLFSALDKFKKSKNVTSGFTLIEILVVISIIAILTATAAVSYTNVQMKSRDGKRKSDIRAIQQALAVYYQDNGRYPPYDFVTPNELIDWCTYISNGSLQQVKNALESTYIKQMPKDPIYGGVPGDYFYKKTAKGHYQLGAVLENTNDPDISTFNFDAANVSDGSGGWNGCLNYLPSKYKYLVTDI
jgi:general secretion pathway protein G